MALEINKVGNYSGKGFLGSNSAKPICGHFLRDLFRGELSQAKVTTTDIVYPGCPVEVKNTAIGAGGTAAGKGLNPNVLSITKKATVATEMVGFVLESPTDILQFGEQAARPLQNQITNIALLGSRVEVYLPADAGLASISLNSKLTWDFDNNCLKVDANGVIEPLGPIVDGVAYKEDNGSVIFQDVKCIRVRL